MTEEHSHKILKIIGIILATFVGAFLAFYLAADITLHRLLSPEYQLKKMEKIIQKQEKSLQQFDKKISENPFEPKMAPMLVNLVKEPSEYKVIVDLKPLNGNEKNIDIQFKNNMLTVVGNLDETSKHSEHVVSFSQSFYINDELNLEMITKEKHGNKYIITIPYDN